MKTEELKKWCKRNKPEFAIADEVVMAPVHPALVNIGDPYYTITGFRIGIDDFDGRSSLLKDLSPKDSHLLGWVYFLDGINGEEIELNQDDIELKDDFNSRHTIARCQIRKLMSGDPILYKGREWRIFSINPSSQEYLLLGEDKRTEKVSMFDQGIQLIVDLGADADYFAARPVIGENPNGFCSERPIFVCPRRDYESMAYSE
jgi:hypothetical protein